MNKNDRIKIMLICDQPDWILGKIAQEFSFYLANYFNITVLSSTDKTFLKKLRKYQRDADLVHFLSPWDFYKCKNSVFIPCVVTLWHMVDWAVFDPHIARIDALCVGSTQWQNRVNEHILGTFPIVRMPYGLDTQEYTRKINARSEYLSENNLPEDTLVLGFAGAASSNQNDRKGLDRLYKSLLLLKTKLDIPVILRMIGKDWQSEMIPADLTFNIDLEKFIPEKDLPRYYSSLDYYLCLSRIEGVPYPVLEAMSCQSLVISTPVGVVPEIIENGINGFILDEENCLEGVFNIIKRTALNFDYRKECGENARQTIIDEFNWENVMDNEIFHEIYMGAIDHFYRRPRFDRIAIKINSLMWKR
jgi:glycosyltransferase involved in cell wall biosynthesis